MHKKGNCIFCSYRFPINTWFICTRYICNFRFCLIHLIKELCIVMRIQVLYTADLKFYAKAVLLTSVNTAPPSRFPSGKDAHTGHLAGPALPLQIRSRTQ